MGKEKSNKRMEDDDDGEMRKERSTKSHRG